MTAHFQSRFGKEIEKSSQKSESDPAPPVSQGHRVTLTILNPLVLGGRILRRTYSHSAPDVTASSTPADPQSFVRSFPHSSGGSKE